MEERRNKGDGVKDRYKVVFINTRFSNRVAAYPIFVKFPEDGCCKMLRNVGEFVPDYIPHPTGTHFHAAAEPLGTRTCEISWSLVFWFVTPCRNMEVGGSV